MEIQAAITLEKLMRNWHYVIASLSLVIALLTSAHAILFKRDTRAAALWLGLIWLIPVLGATLYLLLGVNRVRRRGSSLRVAEPAPRLAPIEGDFCPYLPPNSLGASQQHLCTLAGLLAKVVELPLTADNRIIPLVNGDAAYPAMLRAIREAKQTITLATYIFDNDRAGAEFADALADAVKRGVDVRVLVDDAGARYTWPPIVSRLRQGGITVSRFLPTFSFSRFFLLNLRIHRKVLVVDGRIGFTGGMNIRAGHCLSYHPKQPVQDLHFQLEGPVVAHLQRVFAKDWKFNTRQRLEGPQWFPELAPAGNVVARGIADGPDEDFEKLRWALLGALACARERVTIVTPYFLPDQSLISALNVAAMRGVEVTIILPSVNNLRYVQWAMMASLWQMLKRGCKVWLTPPPFDHTKLMLVDGCWSLIGSANWDPRSLRLNFEFNVECYNNELTSQLNAIVQEKLRLARPLTLADVDGRNVAIKLRDGVARMFSPFM